MAGCSPVYGFLTYIRRFVSAFHILTPTVSSAPASDDCTSFLLHRDDGVVLSLGTQSAPPRMDSYSPRQRGSFSYSVNRGLPYDAPPLSARGAGGSLLRFMTPRLLLVTWCSPQFHLMSSQNVLIFVSSKRYNSIKRVPKGFNVFQSVYLYIHVPCGLSTCTNIPNNRATVIWRPWPLNP